MKDLKKLSLKEEINREVENTEKEIEDRKDIEDLKVSEDFETSLFNKIQEYEFDKKMKKKVHRKKRKRYMIVALAAVLVLIFGSVMTGVGSKSYWKVLLEKDGGEDKYSIINVENMNSQETEELDEVEISKEIANDLGIEVVRFGYKPEKMYLERYEIDASQKRAVLFYQYNSQIIRYSMYMNNDDSSFSQKKVDKLVDEYQVDKNNFHVVIRLYKYEVNQNEENRYIAEFEYKDAQYQIMGIMDEDEMIKIIENLYFF